MYDIGGGPDVLSEVQVDLTFPEGTDLDSVASYIYDGLKVFRGFNESAHYGVISSNGYATFFSRKVLTPSSVKLTNYDPARVVVADTAGLHFLVGTRNFRVYQSGSNQLTLATSALEHFNGSVNRAAGNLFGFRSGQQHGIWTEYFYNIARHNGGIYGTPRISERVIGR